MKPSSPYGSFRAAAVTCLAVILTAGAGCTTGPLTVEETSYLAISNGEDTNYFRITMKADTALGVAELRQGWYPASAVDALYGAVSEEAEGKALLTREKLRTQLDESILETQKKYLAAAQNPSTSETELRRLRRAQVRVRQAPQDSAFGRKDAQTIQYNPAKGLVVHKSDEKLVWVLSSNPDDVIGAIANFSEQESTQKDILKFTEVVIQGRRNEVVSKRAANTFRRQDDTLIAKQIEIAQEALKSAKTPSEVNGQIEALVQLLRAMGAE